MPLLNFDSWKIQRWVSKHGKAWHLQSKYEKTSLGLDQWFKEVDDEMYQEYNDPQKRKYQQWQCFVTIIDNIYSAHEHGTPMPVIPASKLTLSSETANLLFGDRNNNNNMKLFLLLLLLIILLVQLLLKNNNNNNRKIIITLLSLRLDNNKIKIKLLLLLLHHQQQ